MDADGRFVAQDRPISIRALKRFACELAGPETRASEQVLQAVQSYVPQVSADAEKLAGLLRAAVSGAFQPADGQRVAIVGAGPAGLAAAHDLALMGLRPVILESEPVPAGMLALGVPAYRLPRDLLAREVAVIRALDAEIRCGVTVGRDVSLRQLRRDYAAVIIAVGAKSSRSLGLVGEGGPRVYGGVDLLRAVALGQFGTADEPALVSEISLSAAGSPLDIGREVVVIGGGNVAYDVARTVLRQIAYDTARTAARLAGIGRVYLASLETLEQMPADTLEIVEGDEEGIVRLNGWGPVEIHRHASGNVRGVTFRRCVRVRFYLLHVMILPLALTVLLAVHFWRIRKDGGMTRPADADQRLGPPPPDTYPVFTEAPAKTYHLAAIVRGRTPAVGRGPEQTVPSVPHLFYAELGVLMLTVLICVALAMVSDAPLKELANPDVPENPAKAPWYFLGLQELVSFSAFMGGTGIPAIVLIGLALIPSLDREQTGTGQWFGGPGGASLVRRAAIVGLASTVALETLVSLAHAGSLSSTQPTATS